MSTELLERQTPGDTGRDSMSHFWCIPCDRSRCGQEGAPPSAPPPSAARCVVCVEMQQDPCSKCGQR